MKIKYLMIVGLILTIMAMGAVSASDNLAVDQADDVVEIDDSIQNEELTADDDCVVYDDGEIRCIINQDVNMGSSQKVVEFTSHNSTKTGNLSFYIDDVEKWYLAIDSDSYDGDGNYYADVSNDFLYYNHFIEMGKTHKMDIKLNNELVLSGTLKVTNFPISVDVFNAYDTSYIEYGDIVFFSVNIPDDAAGRFTVTVNGKTYDFKNNNGNAVAAVDINGWILGDYVAVVKYGGDAKYNATTVKKTFTIHPKISYPLVPISYSSFYLIYMSAGEKETIAFIGPSDASGKVEVKVKSQGEIIKSQNVTVSKGYGSFTLSGLDAGAYMVYYKGTIGGMAIDNELMVEVFDNSKDAAASLSANQITAGGNAVVKISGPADTMASVLVDDVFVKAVYLNGKEISEAISGLAVGNHEIKILVISPMTYSPLYSETFYVTVKAKPVADTVKMTLKKVKVKKSAKKLVLSATLKINGKAIKSKIIKFKFNKKTYTAKTDAKGIAKVTIKKSVLKKLKAGKKITYQASYGKTIKKITVKVLK